VAGLVELLETLPQPDPLPKMPGSTVAIVGDRLASIELARDLAAELGADPSKVVLASNGYRGRAFPEELRITSADAAEERRRSWRRRKRPTVVVVEAMPGQRTGRWASKLLDSLEPTMTWAVVEAFRKPDDIAAWADFLGGVDALAVIGLDETVSPAAVLRSGIPVGRIDGRPATPAQWAAILTERLAA
jgi:hypothetical protein